jgi:DNA-binding transcriptional LysR family regulator
MQVIRRPIPGALRAPLSRAHGNDGAPGLANRQRYVKRLFAINASNGINQYTCVMDLSSRDLRLVTTIDRYRHFGRSADALGISQPALSRALKSLESRLGEALFIRSRAGVETTDLGRLIADRARGLLAEISDLERDIELARQDGVGELTVAVGHFPAEISVAPAVRDVLAGRPRLKLTLRSQDWVGIKESLLSREIDLAFCETSGVESDDRFRIRPVGNHPVFFFTRKGHPLARRASLGIGDMFDYPWAAPVIPWRAASSFPLDSPDVAAGVLDPERRVFLPRVMITSLQLAKNIVVGSDSLAFGMLTQIRDEIDAGQLELVRFHAPWMYLHYGFVWLTKRTMSTEAEEFVTRIEAAEARLRASEEILRRRYWGDRPLDGE